MIPPAPSLDGTNTCCTALRGVVPTDCTVLVFPVIIWSVKDKETERISAPVLCWACVCASGHANPPSLLTSQSAVSWLLCSP